MGFHGAMSDSQTTKYAVHSSVSQVGHQGACSVLYSSRWESPEQAAAHLQAGRRDSLRPHKLHDEHMHAQMHGPRAADAGRLEAGQVPELLLRPQLHHLPRIALAVAGAEAEVPLHVPGHSTGM